MHKLKEVLTAEGFDAGSLRRLFANERSGTLALSHRGGYEAVVAWRRLRRLVVGLGYYPVLLGEEQEAKEAAADAESMAQGRDGVGDLLQRSLAIDTPTWFDRRRAERVEDFHACNPGEELPEVLSNEGDWPDDALPNCEFGTPFDILTRKAHRRVAIALVQSASPWEVPAHLAFGGWNECPSPEEHCAVMRYWQEKYGAEVVAVTRDVVEMQVDRPPGTREAALVLAREQYTYCEDIVDQGTNTVANLAGGLLFGTSWYFWWD